MKVVSAKSLTVGGVYLVGYAKRVALQTIQAGQRMVHKVIDGYIIRVVATSTRAEATIIDTPGRLYIVRQTGSKDQTVGVRDVYDSRSGSVDGPYTAASVEFPLTSIGARSLRWMFGYQVNPDPDLLNPADKSSLAYTTTSPRIEFNGELPTQSALTVYNKNNTLATEPSSGFPVIPQIGHLAFAEVRTYSALAKAAGETDVTAGFTRSSGFTMSHDYLTTLGYTDYHFHKLSELGYVSFMYQNHAPSSVMFGDVRITAVPVCKQLGSGVEHWGEAGLLLICTRLVLEVPNQPAVKWHHMWVPSSHPAEAMQPGPFLDSPWGVSGPGQNTTAWQEFMLTTTPGVPFGSRPSFIDALSGCVETITVGDVAVDRALFRFRYATLAQATTGSPGFSGTHAPADALVEIRVNDAGSMTISYPFYDVATTDDAYGVYDPDPTAYTEFVQGILDETTFRTRVPYATLRSSKHGAVSIDLVSEQPRVTRAFASQRGAPWIASDPTRWGLRISSNSGVRNINFNTVGWGVFGGFTRSAMSGTGDDYIVLAGCSSYFNVSPGYGFGLLSADELGVIVTDRWDVYAVSVGFEVIVQQRPASLAAINLVTGAFRIVGAIGASQRVTISSYLNLHLNVVQQRIVDEDGLVVVEGVYMVSKPDKPGSGEQSVVRISRDSGVTWSDYVPSGQITYLTGTVFGGTQILDTPSGAAVLRG